MNTQLNMSEGAGGPGQAFMTSGRRDVQDAVRAVNQNATRGDIQRTAQVAQEAGLNPANPQHVRQIETVRESATKVVEKQIQDGKVAPEMGPAVIEKAMKQALASGALNIPKAAGGPNYFNQAKQALDHKKLAEALKKEGLNLADFRMPSDSGSKQKIDYRKLEEVLREKNIELGKIISTSMAQPGAQVGNNKAGLQGKLNDTDKKTTDKIKKKGLGEGLGAGPTDAA
ncbi:MAG: hypothetical protein FWC68_04410 [Oscillospiraceae bacterium]|nr:hypothetical protein [Oscillospiraceae bacterium]